MRKDSIWNQYLRYRRVVMLLGLLACATLLMVSCKMAPPEAAPLDAATPIPLPASGESVMENTTQSSVVAEYIKLTTDESVSGILEKPLIQPPEQVAICYDATFSMMGFVDMHGSNEYKNTLPITDASISASFPGVKKQYFRLGQEAGPEALQTEIELSAAQNVSFYLNEDLLKQPERIMLEGAAAIQTGLRMNEPVQGFYHATKKPVPAENREVSNPVSQALDCLKQNDFLILVTDLEELQTNMALAQSIEQKVLAQDKIMGITVVNSSFSGLAPLWSKGEDIWFEWGAQPTGSCEFMFDYVDYRIGLTIDPDQRGVKKRPFYILSIGQSDNVNEYQLSLGSQLGNLGIPYAMSIFDSDFRPMYYQMNNRIYSDQVTVSQGGVNLLPVLHPDSVAGVQLEKPRSTNQGDDTRWMRIPLSFLPRLSDPRVSQFLPEDFGLIVYLQQKEEDGSYGERRLAEQEMAMDLAVENRTNGTAFLTVQASFPQSKMEKGDYLVTVQVLLNPPGTYAIPDWASEYNLTLDNDSIIQMTSGRDSFDGGKTIGINHLFSAITSYQQKTAETYAIGEFSLELTVLVP